MDARLGNLFVHALVTKFGFSFRRYESCLKEFGRSRIDPEHRLVLEFNHRKRLPRKTKLIELLPLLTFVHERQHYQDILSTPCGLFLWRSFYAQVSTGGFILRKLREHSAIDSNKTRLLEWLDAGGEDWLRQNQVLGSDYPVLAAKILELKVLRKTTTAFNHHQPCSMKEFLDLADHAFALFRRRFELPDNGFRWAARNVQSSSYLPGPEFGLTGIMEANARLAERLVLRDLGASAALVKEWNDRFLSSTEPSVYHWILDELRSPWLARVAIDIALMGPVDLACADPEQEPVLVEDALPGWRLTRIVPLMKQLIVPFEQTELTKVCYHEIPAEIGIESPASVINALLSQPLSSPGCYSRDAALALDENPVRLMDSYFEQVEDNFKTAFGKRRPDPLTFAWCKVRDVVPLVEFFQDRVVFHFKQLAGAPPQRIILRYCDLLNDLIVLALFDHGDFTQIFELESLFIEELKRRGAPREEYPPAVSEMIAEITHGRI